MGPLRATVPTGHAHMFSLPRHPTRQYSYLANGLWLIVCCIHELPNIDDILDSTFLPAYCSCVLRGHLEPEGDSIQLGEPDGLPYSLPSHSK